MMTHDITVVRLFVRKEKRVLAIRCCEFEAPTNQWPLPFDSWWIAEKSGNQCALVVDLVFQVPLIEEC